MPTRLLSRFSAWSALLVCAVLLAGPLVASADNAACTRCHDDVTFKSAAHPDLGCADCHTNITSTPHDALPDDQKLTGNQICAGCHRMAAKQLPKSVHDKHSCKKCHGPGHDVDLVSSPDSKLSAVNQIRTCGKCHDEVIAGFENSVHGKGLLKSGLTGAAPSCSSCHGSHNIQKVGDPAAKTGHAKVPETCGACHTTVLKHWEDESTHGELWKEGKDGPVCTTCHMDQHTISDPTSAAMRMHFPGECGNCHKESIVSFRDSFHGKATELGWTSVAMCSDCHTPHQNLPASDPRSTVNPANLAATCGKCHEEEVKNAGFMTFDPHVMPHDPTTRWEIRWIYLFMTGLLLGVFAFFFVHDFLWLQRALVGKMRGEYKAGHGGAGPYVKRFSNAQIWLHVSIVTSFLLLAITGLPLKFAVAPWAGEMMKLLGGAHAAGLIHRFAAIVTFGYFAVHLSMVLYGAFVKGEKGFFWGWRSMVPNLKDVQDFWGNIKYFLYVGKRPQIDRWAYWEKFDYLAVFWGVAMIGVSGLMLWQPGFFARFVPGWALNAAYIIHSDEALLATGFIFIFHFFHTHLRPESFPMDPVIFTGAMPLEKFKEERPLEYQRLVESKQLDKFLVPAPEKSNLTAAYVFGFIAVAIGIACAVGIFVALWGQFFG
jgi:cytochrome b subunit of formate dehydrogenase